jgi:predicted Na+-dependent transporter
MLCFYINLVAGQQEYSSRQAGITAGIVLAVLVPILLGLVCVAYQLLVRKKREAKYKVRDNPVVRQVETLDNIVSCVGLAVLL